MSEAHLEQFMKRVAEREALQAKIGTASPTAIRYYNLDALRGFAMLLGIGLHAAIPFVPYSEPDDSGSGLLVLFFLFVHGFRMPLFFLLSGFFPSMLWRRRGLRFLIEHRLKRIGLPLLIGVFTVLPAVIIGLVGGLVLSGVDLDNIDPEKAATGYSEQLEVDSDFDAEPQNTEVPVAGTDEEPFEFAHMWFLWFLLWMVAGFATVVTTIRWLVRKAGHKQPIPTSLLTGVLWSLPEVTLIPQMMMVERSFGPDTSAGLVPAVHVLAYYGCFFSFGALAYDRNNRHGLALIESLGRRWILLLTLSTVLLFGPGLALIETSWATASAIQVTFAWTMSFGLIGLFRRFMSAERFWVRYLSDASYWMYLAHLPLVFVAQGLIAGWDIPAIPKFLVISASVTAILLVTYQYLVRYRAIGSLLNGKRVRVVETPI